VSRSAGTSSSGFSWIKERHETIVVMSVLRCILPGVQRLLCDVVKSLFSKYSLFADCLELTESLPLLFLSGCKTSKGISYQAFLVELDPCIL